MDMLTAPHIPQWLEALLTEKFYNACIFHEEERRNEKNIFCLDCCDSICPHCLKPHASHRLLQIRRYVYHDVLKLCDADKLMDCAFVQAYVTNGAKVVFLNQRPQTKPCRPSGSDCSTCDRSIKYPFLYCSLSCKLQYLLRTEGTVSSYITKHENISLPEPPRPDDGQMTPDSVLERTAESASTESCEPSLREFACTATTQIVRKKRSPFPTLRRVFSPAKEMTVATSNRRKGNQPQRSPLY
ncbi:B box-type domain-containing protein [Heracleum sosnowskyi]|uniref:B box-type domain-containing protein n=1 Tax=Heracleum sosnowskyi TaxID=360622 RepID=A0AAD8NAP6_9APIA|nr:B box-type domain-containing protein [Heracleum sosnowskyi]